MWKCTNCGATNPSSDNCCAYCDQIKTSINPSKPVSTYEKSKRDTDQTIVISKNIKAHIWVKNQKREIFINQIKVSDNNIQFFYDEDLRHSVNYDKSNGVYRKHSGWLVIAPKCFYEVSIVYEGNASMGGCTLKDLDAQCTKVYLLLCNYLSEYSDEDVKNLTPTNLVTQNEEFTETVTKKTNNDMTFFAIGIISFILQFIFFLIAKFNLKNNYTEEAIGTIQIGNMIGADTVVHQSSSVSPLGVFAVIMMGICCITFFILAGLSNNKGTGKNMPLFGVFAVLTIIGGLIVAIY